MRTARTVAEVRDALSAARREGARIGLVPTMGALHDGHLSLVRAARRSCDAVVVSLFVNPAQFGPGEDLDAYPRDEARDAELPRPRAWTCSTRRGVRRGLPRGVRDRGRGRRASPRSSEGDPARRGAGHFRGVTTVVAKLLNVVGPQVAYFGQKDAQQAVVIRRMARDLDFPVEIEVLPTVREPDGLAMSSRNAYLSDEERARAPALCAVRCERARRPPASGASVDAALDAARERACERRDRAGVRRGPRRREPDPGP